MDDIVAECQLIEAVGILAACQVTIIPVQGVMFSTIFGIIILLY